MTPGEAAVVAGSLGAFTSLLTGLLGYRISARMGTVAAKTAELTEQKNLFDMGTKLREELRGELQEVRRQVQQEREDCAKQLSAQADEIRSLRNEVGQLHNTLAKQAATISQLHLRRVIGAGDQGHSPEHRRITDLLPGNEDGSV